LGGVVDYFRLNASLVPWGGMIRYTFARDTQSSED